MGNQYATDKKGVWVPLGFLFFLAALGFVSLSNPAALDNIWIRFLLAGVIIVVSFGGEFAVRSGNRQALWLESALGGICFQNTSPKILVVLGTAALLVPFEFVQLFLGWPLLSWGVVLFFMRHKIKQYPFLGERVGRIYGILGFSRLVSALAYVIVAGKNSGERWALIRALGMILILVFFSWSSFSFSSPSFL